MKLSDNFRIEYDENNVVLVHSEERNNKKGKPHTYETNFYYPSVKWALKAFLNKHLKGSSTVEEVLDRIDKVEKLIMDSNGF